MVVYREVHKNIFKTPKIKVDNVFRDAIIKNLREPGASRWNIPFSLYTISWFSQALGVHHRDSTYWAQASWIYSGGGTARVVQKR